MRPHMFLLLTLAACSGGIGDQGGIGNDKEDTGTPANGTPDIAVTESSIDFGSVAYGELISSSITITNRGEGDLNISSITTASPFAVTPPSLTLLPGSSTRITVTVQPITYDVFQGSVSLSSDDPDNGTVSVQLYANTVIDADADGYSLVEAGGDDCDDTDPEVNPSQDEIWYDGVDQNCNGDNDYDQDNDGYETTAHNTDLTTGGDCQDINPNFHPGAVDVPYDNMDTNCDDLDDWDYDQDGYRSAFYDKGTDCDDSDATINPIGDESFNGLDDDCEDGPDYYASPEFSAYIYEAPSSSDKAGYSAAIGDLDNDDMAEVIFSAPAAGSSNAGSVAIIEGDDLLASGDALDDADNYVEGESSDQLGSYVAILGDCDGNSFAELAMGAPGHSGGAGAVYLLPGEEAVSGGDLGDLLVTYTGTSGAKLGLGIVSDLDLDGDDYADLGAMYQSGSGNNIGLRYGGQGDEGEVSLSSFDALFSTSGDGEAFYRNAPIGGDMDGDGYEDLVLSDGGADSDASNGGAVWILWGGSARYSTSGVTRSIEDEADVVLAGAVADAGWGTASQPGADWDGDGDMELWVYNADSGLYVLEGRPRFGWSGLDPSTDAAVSYAWELDTSPAAHIRNIGDWTGDGLGDMLVFLEDTSSSYGLSWRFVSEVQDGSWTEDEYQGSLAGGATYGNANVGYGMAPQGGDVDGDGDADFLAGDPEFDSSAGQAYLFINRTTD